MISIRPELTIDVKDIPEVKDYKIGDKCFFKVTGKKVGEHAHDLGGKNSEHKADFVIEKVEIFKSKNSKEKDEKEESSDEK